MSNSTFLAIDTSTDACSVALLHQDKIVSDHQLLPREHTQNILPMVQSLLTSQGLDMSQVDGLVVGAGPGSFTGLRIAFGVVQGLAFAVSKPVAAVSTLSALALRARDLSGLKDGVILASIDARMNELYWSKAVVESAQLTQLTEPQVGAIQDVGVADCSVMIGTGLVYSEQLDLISDSVESYPEERPRAEDLLRFVQEYPDKVVWQDAHSVEPLYVRNNVAKKKAEQGS